MESHWLIKELRQEVMTSPLVSAFCLGNSRAPFGTKKIRIKIGFNEISTNLRLYTFHLGFTVCVDWASYLLSSCDPSTAMLTSFNARVVQWRRHHQGASFACGSERGRPHYGKNNNKLIHFRKTGENFRFKEGKENLSKPVPSAALTFPQSYLNPRSLRSPLPLSSNPHVGDGPLSEGDSQGLELPDWLCRQRNASGKLVFGLE